VQQIVPIQRRHLKLAEKSLISWFFSRTAAKSILCLSFVKPHSGESSPQTGGRDRTAPRKQSSIVKTATPREDRYQKATRKSSLPKENDLFFARTI
jgi:hypothetical protein